jgi:NAD(P)-dependent dehydrogenase (short-subunit alcohol dehydrogenase family)
MAIIDKFDLTGRTALVTGASSGLGWRFAEALAEQGAHVVLAARRTERLDELKCQIEAAGGTATTVALDVTDRASIDAAFAAIGDAGLTADILVNNAGIAREAWALDMTPDDWSSVMDTNLDGVWFVAQAAARRMVEAGTGGSIVNIASLLGLRVSPTLSAYAVAKAGVVQMTKALALEWARHRIRVNAIAPGYVLTEINRHFFASDDAKPFIARIPQRRIAEPDELDGALLLLASPASSFMTGSVITVDGGHGLAFG